MGKSIDYDKIMGDNLWLEDGKWYYNVICPSCGEKNLKYSSEKYNAKRGYCNFIKNGNVCRSCYKESSKGEGNVFYGKKHSIETIETISNSRKGQYSGENHHMKKQEYRELFSIKTKKLWEDGKISRENVSNKILENHEKGKMIKGLNYSKQETEISEKLESMGIEHKRWFQIENKNYDIFIPKYNLIIEYNGDYWHCNPNKYDKDYFHQIKNKTAKELWEKDKQRVYIAEKNGYNLEVIWESEYKITPNIINKIIKKYEY